MIMSWTYSDGLSKLVSAAVKLSIKSFAVPELFVDLPESASVANLKVCQGWPVTAYRLNEILYDLCISWQTMYSNLGVGIPVDPFFTVSDSVGQP
jgi:hypothetical protein